MLDQESRHHPLPCRRIRVNQSAKRAGLAPHDLVQARALLRHKDVVLRAVARAGDDAMLAADALRMERDAAHEECARLTATRVTPGGATVKSRPSGALRIDWISEHEHAVVVTRDVMDRIVTSHNALLAIVGESARIHAEDAERIATLTAERDHARAIAVALEQGLTVDTTQEG